MHESTPILPTAGRPTEAPDALDTPDVPDTRRIAHCIGTGGELFWLSLKVWLLSLITLGVYSFWGKARVRRYLWSHSLVLGDPLEYTGTGGELFRSFLLVIIPFGMLWLGFSALGARYPASSLLLIVIGVPFAHYAAFQALRYRLTRTRWRGIRGNMTGSAIRYALKASLYSLLAVVTLGIAMPHSKARQTSLRANAAWFGSRRFAFSGTGGPLYRAWFASAGLWLLFTIALATLLLGGVYLIEQVYGIRTEGWLAFSVMPVMLLLACAFFFSFLIYRAACLRWLADNLRFGGVRFAAPQITARALFRLHAINLLLLICTLGLAHAWTQVRILRFMQNRVLYCGDPDLETLLQDTKPVTVSGEGFLDALDMDIGL